MLAPRAWEFLRFCLVGFLAFSVDAGLLELLVAGGMDAYAARAMSMAVALSVSYFLHQLFTFRNSASGPGAKRFTRFITSNLIGAAINYSVFILLLYLNLSADAQTSRLIAQLVATAIALIFNYWANRRFVFAAKELS